jgi:hypothetical protein
VYRFNRRVAAGVIGGGMALAGVMALACSSSSEHESQDAAGSLDAASDDESSEDDFPTYDAYGGPADAGDADFDCPQNSRQQNTGLCNYDCVGNTYIEVPLSDCTVGSLCEIDAAYALCIGTTYAQCDCYPPAADAGYTLAKFPVCDAGSDAKDGGTVADSGTIDAPKGD